MNIIRLQRAKSLVRIYRRGLDYVDGYYMGFIVANNAEHLLVHKVDPAVVLDGYGLLRVSDISEISLSHPSRAFMEQALILRGLHASCPFPLRVKDTMHSLLPRIQALFPIITLHRERRFRDSCWIGKVSRISPRSLFLREITPAAIWEDFDSRFSLAGISLLEFGGSYESALAAVAQNAAEQDASANS
jgi:hypothetical protein